ncbi:fasciclin domain-containing protein, partial [Salmonella sp. s54925]|uniref:fasciclin domain-containing protein n=1 Tax=Salmonella sp. s54925 TaxID=3159674 RepID=UPI00397EB703
KIRFEHYSGTIYGSCKQFGDKRNLDQTYNNGILDLINGMMIPPAGNLLDVLSQGKSLSILQNYMSKALLKPLLQKQDPLTFLAPNDAAFKKLAPDVIDKLNNDRGFLDSVMEYRLLSDIYCSVGFEN